MPVVLQFSGDQVGVYTSVQDSGAGTSTINVNELPFLPTDQILIAFTDDSFDANGEFLPNGPITIAFVQVIRDGVTYEFTVNGNGRVRDSDDGTSKYQGDTFFVTQSTIGGPATGPFAGFGSEQLVFTAGGSLTTGAVVLVQDSGLNPNGIFDTTNAGNVVCFCSGTFIETPRGAVRVDDLQVGDQVITADAGPQPIRWIGRRSLTRAELRPHLRPVRIEAHAFGPDMPRTPLLVSPQHRILLSDWRAELLFGAAEVFAPAISCVNDRTIRQVLPSETITYHHIGLDQHEVLFANGLPAESFFPGDMAMAALPEAQRSEIDSLFPQMGAPRMSGPAQTARTVIRGYEAQLLAA